MTQLLERAVEHLQALPTDEQDRLRARILDHLEKHEALRSAIAEGNQDIAEGDVFPFDAEDIIRRGRERRNVEPDVLS